MLKFASFLLLALSMMFCSGCSALFAQSGKNVHRVLTAGKPDQQIRKVLGLPISQETFSGSRPASDIPELVRLQRVLSDLPLDALLSGYEEYEYRGNVYAPQRYQAFGMIGGMTFGAGEVIQFPWLVSYTVKEGKVVHRFRVWYRPERTYFSHVWSDDYWAEEVMGWPPRWRTQKQ
ncbi:MAG: hypothetical protein U1F83_13585 [Verrucomicrobiota bacterium]